MKNLILIIIICTLSHISVAQVRGFDIFPDDDEIEKSEMKERYESLDLYWHEWLCMVAGVTLFAFARKFEYTNPKSYRVLTVISVIIGFPLLYLIGTLVTTALYYIIILLFIYCLLSIFLKK